MTASFESRREMLRQSVDELVGSAFFGQMLKVARNSVLKGEYGHGGRGEEVFGAQLDHELARQVARGTRHGLNEAIFDRYAPYLEKA